MASIRTMFHRSVIWIFAALMVLGAAGTVLAADEGRAAAEAGKPVRMAPRELAALLKEKQGEYVVVDVREPKEYAQGHIPGAVNLPLGTLPASAGNLPKEKGIVLYCQSGRRSTNAYHKLVGLGYPSILETTYVDWKDAGLPVAK